MQPLFVEFVNTLHWYEGAPIELIGSESDFAAWLLEQGLPPADVTGCLPDIHRLREHVRGMETTFSTRWEEPGGYPWTRLGYTYNWSADSKTHYGASEYVIRAPATLTALTSNSLSWRAKPSTRAASGASPEYFGSGSTGCR